MRDKLNENPVAQIAVVAVLLLVVGVFMLGNFSGGEAAPEGEAETATPAEAAVAGAPEEAAATGSLEEVSAAAATASVAAPSTRPLPQDVEAAYEQGKTIVLLVYRQGGIDDKLVSEATNAVAGMSTVALFETPAGQVARYAAITGPLGVNQAPALIVVRSRDLNEGGAAPATVTYGFQSGSDVVQAVVDSGYTGPQLTYAPN